MRITKVDVKKWRILESPRAELRSKCAVIIGENGSGKSTLIELILTVFELVYKRLKVPKATCAVDGFYLEYQTEEADGIAHTVIFESGYLEGSNPGELNILIDGDAYSIKEDNGERLKAYLPANIIAYYAGDTERVMSICNYFINERLDAVRKSGNKYTLTPLFLPADTPFIYSDLRHLPIALMSLLAQNVESETIEKLNIRIESVVHTIRLKKPHWATAESADFWGNNSQLFNDFLMGLIEHSIRSTSAEDYIEVEISGMNLQDFLDEVGITNKGVFLFQIFDLLYNNGLLDWVDVKWNRQGEEMTATPISIEYLSEGEKQVVMTSALVELWDKENCLFLLDEPDTFLHPKWQSRFLPEVLQKLERSQAIITTHSALMVSTIKEGCDLYMMKKSKVIVFNLNTYGMDANEIITLAMETAPRAQYVDNLIKQIQEDIKKRNLDSAKENLEELKGYGVSEFNINRLRSTIERLETIGR